MVGSKEVRDAGGVHVIQTFVSEEESEAKQTEGRTARQGNLGSYEMILSEDSLVLYGLTLADASTMAPKDLYKHIER